MLPFFNKNILYLLLDFSRLEIWKNNKILSSKSPLLYLISPLSFIIVYSCKPWTYPANQTPRVKCFSFVCVGIVRSLNLYAEMRPYKTNEWTVGSLKVNFLNGNNCSWLMNLFFSIQYRKNPKLHKISVLTFVLRKCVIN